jgi:DMSO/TMAO reductase YedYZ molybdopterin-dependent catalytic subunit
MSTPSRRKLIVSGIAASLGAGASAVGLARLADKYGLLPPDCGGIYGAGTTLTYASQKLLARHANAREFPRSAISPAPFAKMRSWKTAAFERLRAGGFADWTLSVEGMVARPQTLSLAELKSLPASSQITELACEEGWSYIAEWTGPTLSRVLQAAGILPQARCVVYYSMQPRWWQSIDMDDALHPQTILVHSMNGGELSYDFGGPLRLRVPRQLGYKSVKYINRLVVTDSLDRFKKGGDYSWYGGI